MSDSSQVKIGYGKETVWGTTPAVAFQADRFTSESFGFDITTTRSREITGDRQTSSLIQTDAGASGSQPGELSAQTYDERLVSALMSSGWSTAVAISLTDISVIASDNSYNTAGGNFMTENISVGQWLKVGGFTTAANNGYARVTSLASGKIIVDGPTLVDESAGDTVTMEGSMIRNGTTQESYTIERHFSDKGMYHLFNGMQIGRLDLQMRMGEPLSLVLGWMGKAMVPGSSSASTGAWAAAGSDVVMSPVAHIGSIREGGVAVENTAYVQNLSAMLDNQLTGRKALGHRGNVGVRTGPLLVTGSFEAYFEDNTFVQKFIDGTLTSIDWRVIDSAGKGYAFTMPRVTYTRANTPTPSDDDDSMNMMEYEATKDPVTGCTFQIDRF